MPTECPFCSLEHDRILYEDDQILIFRDGYPVSPGHMLVIPRRHVATWFDATLDEHHALVRGIDRARELILDRHAPDGFNIGINAGEAGGQTVFHLHVHVIPRYTGDVPNPRGGVRHVIPSKGSYSPGEPPRIWHAHAPHRVSPARSEPLVRGELDSLLPLLRDQIDRSQRVDIAVAFVTLKGLELIETSLLELVDRHGSLRLLTGDYLDTTEPEALVRLLELKQRSTNVSVRIFEATTTSFHPKAYVFHFDDDDGIAYVGSSNLTRTALKTGLEWNYELVATRDVVGFKDVAAGFDSVFQHSKTREVDYEWIDAYRKRRASKPVLPNPEADPTLALPEPHSVQSEALEALVQTRQEGNQAGLVVLATGLGKTWLCAFDSTRPEYRRILFVAHREEILRQARDAFTRVRPEATTGFYFGGTRNPNADIVFALIQSIGRPSNLHSFDRRAFDYIVVDEFHHGTAPSYRRLIDHFQPKFLLGLTATPERTDGGDLLGLCGENLVYRCDSWEGIKRGLLSPFQYFGVPDDVEYANIPWRNSRFDEAALTTALATETRARNALEQYRLRAGRRTLAFCCSRRHADFMAGYFASAALRTASVHSGDTSAPRAESLRKLEAGELDVLFTVDMFNEGLDIPSIDTVMMLRPTESRIIWLQQFGRGLRRTDDKPYLTVVDYIGNHRMFLSNARALLNLGAGVEEIRRALDRFRNGTLSQDLPPGCEIIYDLESVDILSALVGERLGARDVLKAYYEDFVAANGTRPRAVEAYHDGYSPQTVRHAFGSWFGFIRDMGGLSIDEPTAATNAAEFLGSLETTKMTRSFKMIVLEAMLAREALPGELSIDALVDEFGSIARRSVPLRADVGAALDDPMALRNLVVTNPVRAWAGGRGMGGVSYFEFDGKMFRTTPRLTAPNPAALRELVRELVDWRLAAYLDRERRRTIGGDSGSFICKVSHANGTPILFLDRTRYPQTPTGWTEIVVNDERMAANFVKIALNVVHRPGSTDNILPEILRGFFGENAGHPGTNHHVVFEPSENEMFALLPVSNAQN